MPKTDSKICKKMPISRLVWQIHLRCLHLPGGFRGWPIQWNQTKCCAADPCCHGNEIWAKIGFNSACMAQMFAPTMARRSGRLPACWEYLSVMFVFWNGSGRASSVDLRSDSERHLFAVDVCWQLLCSSTTLNESLLQVAVWVSISAVNSMKIPSLRRMHNPAVL